VTETNDPTDEYIASVYHDEDPTTFVRLSELPQEIGKRVMNALQALPPEAWSPMAHPADQFFMRENRRLPMRCYEAMAKR